MEIQKIRLLHITSMYTIESPFFITLLLLKGGAYS
jgi:hypothetical protein